VEFLHRFYPIGSQMAVWFSASHAGHALLPTHIFWYPFLVQFRSNSWQRVYRDWGKPCLGYRSISTSSVLHCWQLIPVLHRQKDVGGTAVFPSVQFLVDRSLMTSFTAPREYTYKGRGSLCAQRRSHVMPFSMSGDTL
jgi:hypothetical protein